jgi:hypothetical protein
LSTFAVDLPYSAVSVTWPGDASGVAIHGLFPGGKDNFATDRTVAEPVTTAWPGMRTATRENRAFIGRAVQYLAAEAGIHQLLDIGSGLPTASNVHEVAQANNLAARVVYADNDPSLGGDLSWWRPWLPSGAGGGNPEGARLVMALPVRAGRRS